MQTKHPYGRTLDGGQLIDARCLAEHVQALSFEVVQLRRDLKAAVDLLQRLKVAHVRHCTETHAGWTGAAISSADQARPLERQLPPAAQPAERPTSTPVLPRASRPVRRQHLATAVANGSYDQASPFWGLAVAAAAVAWTAASGSRADRWSGRLPPRRRCR